LKPAKAGFSFKVAGLKFRGIRRKTNFQDPLKFDGWNGVAGIFDAVRV
jgi:hypothetical protein